MHKINEDLLKIIDLQTKALDDCRINVQMTEEKWASVFDNWYVEEKLENSMAISREQFEQCMKVETQNFVEPLEKSESKINNSDITCPHGLVNPEMMWKVKRISLVRLNFNLECLYKAE